MEPILSIIVLSFNHEKYIEKCLSGIFGQSTDYSYEVIISDDNSEDNTAKIIQGIIKNRNNVVFIKRDRNVGMNINSIDTIGISRGKYIALCEGDDYWIYNKKIDRQINLFENSNEYAMSFTNARIYHEKYNVEQNRLFIRRNIEKNIENNCANIYSELLKRNFIPTATVCFKREMIIRAEKEISNIKDLKMKDYPTWLYIAKNYKIKYIPLITAVYRLHEKSLSNSNIKYQRMAFMKNTVEIKQYFINGNNRKLIDEKKLLFGRINVFEIRYIYERIKYVVKVILLRCNIY